MQQTHDVTQIHRDPCYPAAHPSLPASGHPLHPTAAIAAERLQRLQLLLPWMLCAALLFQHLAAPLAAS
jgi:hypothetical protein